MELSVGEVIYKLRKERKITQEKLANAVGVSAQAVSKWESKNSYPDITILPSIARFFDISIDELLSFNKDISNEDVMKIMKDLAKKFEDDGIEKALKASEEVLIEYPNNLFLKFRLGSLYMMYMASVTNEGEAKNILNKAIVLLEQATTSSESEISEGAKYILSSLYTMNEQGDKAEEILLSFPKVTLDRDDMLIALYINQNKYDKAKEILINLTLKRVVNTIQSLNSYISIYFKENDIKKAKKILNIQNEIIKIFELEGIYNVNSNIMFASIYAKERNIEKTLDHLQYVIEHVDDEYDFNGHMLFDGVKLSEPIHSKKYVIGNLIKILKGELSEENEYEFLNGNERYEKLINKLDSLI